MSFDTLAPYYRLMERVTAGDILQRCRTSFLTEAGTCRRALLLGEGPGRFLGELLRANPHIEVTCVERSPRMIAEARDRLTQTELGRVRFEPADALAWQAAPHQFDLIVTHFFLDCFQPDELAPLVSKLALCATRDARWLVADFREPETGWRRWRARAVLALLYAFFRTVTELSASRLTPPDEFLARVGFRLTARRFANHGLVHSDLWERGVA
jgi:ubiquinone/menaquinone biosynthesis C-methylase UbiE